jgi:hypothetical protein
VINSRRTLPGLGVLAIVGAAALLLASSASAARVKVPSRFDGAIHGKVYHKRFRLPVSVVVKRRIRGERNPIHLAITTRTNTDRVGSEFFVSALRYTTPFTGRKVTLRYLRVRVAGRRVSAKLKQTHKAEAAVLGALFTAPNVCLTVYLPLYCVGVSGPEQFYFKAGAKARLRVGRRRLSGTLKGQGAGLTQILPYPPVRYKARISARRR